MLIKHLQDVIESLIRNIVKIKLPNPSNIIRFTVLLTLWNKMTDDCKLKMLDFKFLH